MRYSILLNASSTFRMSNGRLILFNFIVFFLKLVQLSLIASSAVGFRELDQASIYSYCSSAL